jgi:alanine-synthesizing transaminase
MPLHLRRKARHVFSRRLDFNLRPNRLSRILAQKHAAGIRLFDLTESNPTRAGFSYKPADILSPLARPSSLRYAPDPRGLLPARQAVADYYADRGEKISAEDIYLTAGTSEAYAFLFKLLADPGEVVLGPQPSYPLLDFLTALESVRLEHYPLGYMDSRGWEMDLESLAAAVDTKPAAVVVVNPNNPTGAFLKHSELEQLNALCAQNDLALICDEVFYDYGKGQDRRRAACLVSNRKTLTFVLSGLSKVCGLPQMKLAWIHVSGPEALCKAAKRRLDFIADTYLSVGTPVQNAAARLLGRRRALQSQIRNRLEANEDFLRQCCAGIAEVQVLNREGGWYAILEIRREGFSEEDWTVSLLEHEDVLVHPGYFFDFSAEDYLVVSLLTPPAVFKQGISRLISRI